MKNEEITFIIPLRIYTPNKMEHWRKRHAKNVKIKNIINIYCKARLSSIKLPAEIHITRIAPRAFDFDNLVFSLKAVRDIISDILIPGLKPGRADGDERLEFRYNQQKGNPKEHLLKIKVNTRA